MTTWQLPNGGVTCFDGHSTQILVMIPFQTVRFLQNCHLEVGVGECEEFELTKEIVARSFLRNVSVVSCARENKALIRICRI